MGPESAIAHIFYGIILYHHIAVQICTLYCGVEWIQIHIPLYQLFLKTKLK